MPRDQFIQSPQFTYQIVSKIAQGSQGEVFKAINLRKQLQVAIKQQGHLSEKELSNLNFLSKTKLNNVINILEIFEIDFTYYVVMELGEQSLRNVMRSLNEEQQIISYFLQIAKGLDEIHSLRFIHRDLKPENILVFGDQSENVKICDLGLIIEKNDFKTSRVGTPCYMAPEFIKTNFYDEKVDVWALGLILYEMINGERFFRANTQEELNQQITEITQNQIDERIDQIEHCSQNIKDILKCMIVKVSNDRLSCANIIQRLDPSVSLQLKLSYQEEQEELKNWMDSQSNKLQQHIDLSKINQLNQERKDKLYDKFHSEFTIWKINQNKIGENELLEHLQTMRKQLEEKEFQNQEFQQQLLIENIEKDDIQTASQLFYNKKMSRIGKQIEEERINFQQKQKDQFEIQIQEKQKEIDYKIDQQIEQENIQEYHEQLRNQKFSMLEEKKMQILKEQEKAKNLIKLCERIVDSNINYLIKQFEEINLEEVTPEILQAKETITQLIQVNSLKQEELKKNQILLSQFITEKQISEIIEFQNKNIQLLIEDRQIEQVNQMMKQVRLSICTNEEVIKQQFNNRTSKLQEQQQNRQDQEELIKNKIVQWEQKLKSIHYPSHDLKQKLYDIKKKFYSCEALTDAQTQYCSFTNGNPSDLIYFINNQIQLIEEQIKQYDQLKEDLRAFERNYIEEREQFMEQIMEQNNLFLGETWKYARNYSFIKKINKDNYPKNIRLIKRQIENKINQLNLVLLRIPNLDFSQKQNDEILQDQSQMIFRIRGEIQEVNSEIQQLNQQLQEEIHQFELEEQINIKKSEVVQELEKQLDFTFQIRSAKQSIQNIVSKISKFQSLQEIKEWEGLLNKLDKQVRMTEGFINGYQTQLFDDSQKKLKTNEELQQLEKQFQEKIKIVESQLQDYQTQIDQIGNQVNQSFPKDLKNINCEMELYKLAERMKLILQSRIAEKRANVFYQQITQSLHTTIFNRSIDSELKFLKQKKQEFEENQKEAEMSLEMTLYNHSTSHSKQQKIIINDLIKLINKLGKKIAFCELGIKHSDQFDLNDLQKSLMDLEDQLELESREVFVYQIWLSKIQQLYSNNNQEGLKKIYPDFKNSIDKGVDKIEFNFKSKWEYITELLKSQYKHVISVKCYSVLLKQKQIKLFCERLLVKKTEVQFAEECFDFAQKWLYHFQHYLTIILEERYCQVEEQSFILKYQNIDKESERKLDMLGNIIKKKNKEQLLSRLNGSKFAKSKLLI